MRLPALLLLMLNGCLGCPGDPNMMEACKKMCGPQGVKSYTIAGCLCVEPREGQK